MSGAKNIPSINPQPSTINYPWLPWLIIAAGALLRIRQYAANRSLWLDEAMLAANIFARPLSELGRPLDYGQVAPIGFLWMERLAVEIFGRNEYALRLFPLVCGILSLVLFYWVARHFLDRPALLLALVLFAVGGHLIYYANETKQYATDVVVALALFWVALRHLETPLDLAGGLRLGVVGGVALWFSHPSVFVLGSVAAILLYLSWRQLGVAQALRLLLIPGLIWVLSFTGLYFQHLAYHTHRSDLSNFHLGAFMPVPPRSLVDLEWYVKNFFGLFIDPVGLSVFGLAAFTFIVGLAALRRKPEGLALLVAPLLLACIASALKKYPFGGRLFLFAVPSLLIMIAAGTRQIVALTADRSQLIGAALVGILLFHPVAKAATNLFRPVTREEIKPVLAHLEAKAKPGDVLYVYYASEPAYEIYRPRFKLGGLKRVTALHRDEDPQTIAPDIARLEHAQRTWFLLTHLNDLEKQVFLTLLRERGTQLDALEASGASVYLYDLSAGPRRGENSPK